MKFKISIILPSINPTKWVNLFNQIKTSVGKYSFEVIAVGPYLPDKIFENRSDFRYIQDYGSPSRCLQIGALMGDGKYLTWFPDDCIIEPLALEKCIDLLETKNHKNGITILYSEGMNYTGEQHLQPEYWVARTHADLRLPMVKDGWKIAPIFMYNLDYFKEMGGLDCRFEHINMNTHDLAFRIQNDGGVLHLSPTKVFASDWKPWSNVNKSPIQRAYEENDKPLFDKFFTDQNVLDTNPDFDNWRAADSVWKRRFQES